MTQTRQLGEFISTKKGYAFKSAWFSNHGVPVVKATNFTEDSIDVTSLQLIEGHIAAQYNEWKLTTDDVVVQTVGSWPSSPASAVGKCIRVPEDANGALLNQNTVILKCNEELDPDFLYYSLRDKRFRKFIENRARGSASQASITLTDIKEFQIFQYELEQQKQIGEVLRCYDNLIENNKRRIALLEESARQLYKEWFVRFRFPGHEHAKIVDGVPEGWEKVKVGDLLTLQRGFDLPLKNRHAGVIPIYASTGINGYHNEYKVKGPGIITGRSGSLGTVMFASSDFWPLNTALWVKEFKKVTPHYALFFLRELRLENYNGGAAVPTLNRNDIHRVEAFAPPEVLLSSFSDYVTPVFKQIDKLVKHNEKLTMARDLLLPKLMSGELAV